MTKNERLILGNAGHAADDAITLDIDPDQKPDVVHDLNVGPYPFKDNQFKEITAHHVAEHLDNIFVFRDELHRICHPEGKIYIEVPHHSSWCAHSPTHKLYFNMIAFDSWCKTEGTWQTGGKFKMLKRELTFHRSFRQVFLHKIFNAHPMAYERFWTYIFPAEHLKVWLQPIK